MKAVRMLIFDWDGTLSDSAGPIVAAMQAAITALDLPPRPDAAIRELIGLGWADALSRLFPGIDIPQVAQRVAEYRRRTPHLSAYEAPLFDGAATALHALAADGYALGVATGKFRDGLDRALLQHGEHLPTFSITRCADETAPKPNPRMLREILEVMRLSPDEALMIGDTEYDVAMARSLGMPALGVACGVHEPRRLLSAGAAAVVDDVAAIPAWLQQRRA